VRSTGFDSTAEHVKQRSRTKNKAKDRAKFNAKTHYHKQKT